jgi:amino acid transporter
MQSDPFWSCAMAINVYLVFFHHFDAARLKKLYWLYALICYGLPFIPAIFCLFYVSKGKGKMYGDATVSPFPLSPKNKIKPRNRIAKLIDNWGNSSGAGSPPPTPSSASPPTTPRSGSPSS